jgi:hypothetical protein
MGALFGLPWLAVLLGLAGDASRSLARGHGPTTTFAVVCHSCDGVVAETQDSRPKSISGPCRCGLTVPTTWKATTDTLKGRPCVSCGLHLYYRGGARTTACLGGGLHQPAPLHQRDWR